MKKTTLTLLLSLTLHFTWAQFSDIYDIDLPSAEFISTLNKSSQEIGSGKTTLSLYIPHTLNSESLASNIRDELAYYYVDCLSFIGVREVMFHEQSGEFVFVSCLDFQLDPNTSPFPRCLVFSGAQGGSENFLKECIIIQKGGGSSLEVYNISTEDEHVFPGYKTTIDLSGTECGVVYSLQRQGLDGIEISRLVGNGFPMSFTGDFGYGTFQVYAIDGDNSQLMDGTVQLSYYPIVENKSAAFYESEISFPQTGGTKQIRIGVSDLLGADYMDLEHILSVCNYGKNETWDTDFRISVSFGTVVHTLTITARPNNADSTRVSSLILGDNDVLSGLYRQLNISQAGHESIRIYEISGPGFIHPGEQFGIMLNGSEQRVNYKLYRDDNLISTKTGTGEMLVFTGLTQTGIYRIDAFADNKTKSMKGEAEVRSSSNQSLNILEYTYHDSLYSVDQTLYDGLGRPTQQINHDVLHSEDLITPIEYDPAGRVAKEYLPFAHETGNSETEDILSKQHLWYSKQHGDNRRYYVEKEFDGSPEDNIKGIYKAGYPSTPFPSHAHVLYTCRKINADDHVKKFSLDGSDVIHEGMHTPGTLLLKKTSGDGTITRDEFYDDQERLVASRTEDLTTYYIYDDMGDLRYVIPPAQEILFSSGRKKLAELRQYCYYYEYNEYGLIYKKYIPGSEPIITLYNKRGLPVLVQDGRMRTNDEWQFTKYDDSERPILTGFCNGSEATHQAALSSATKFYEKLIPGRWTPGNKGVLGYTCETYPQNRTSDKYLTVTYYDNYGWFDYGLRPFDVLESSGNSRTWSAVGQKTGFKERVIKADGTLGEWLTSTYYYNSDYLLLQTVSDMYPGGEEVVTHHYNLSGKITCTRVKQAIPNLIYTLHYSRYFKYNKRNQLVQIRQNIVGENYKNDFHPQLIDYWYDALGRLSDYNVHDLGSLASYKYNSHGELSSIRSTHFSLKLGYDEPEFATPCYDGKISEMIWKNKTGERKGYAYSYDNYGRLVNADYKTDINNSWVDSHAYDVENITYDYNGNLTHLLRKNSQGNTLHDITYNYGNTSNGNAIQSLRVNNVNTGTYAYDLNGNMTRDGRRNINISYNYLNLPAKINTEVSYVYTSTGRKLEMKVGNSSTYYRGDVVYNGNLLSRIEHPAGFVNITHSASSFQCDYYYTLRNHLGNVLAVGGPTTTPPYFSIIQTNEYYPFGLAFSYNNLNNNKRLFNDKPLQDASVNGEMLNLYDFGSRYYDPLIGRWETLDPLSELYYPLSPYNYCANNPVQYIDPNGESIHLNRIGDVVKEYNDGDDGVYTHYNLSHWDNKSILSKSGGGITYIGNLGGTINMNEIFANRLIFVKQMAESMNIRDFYYAVKTNSYWDLKYNENTIWGVAWRFDEDHSAETLFKFERYLMNAADVGNFHYGIAGKYTYQGRGMPNILLETAAGLAEIWKNNGDCYHLNLQQLTSLTRPYGDRPFDNYWIREGMKYAEQSKKLNK